MQPEASPVLTNVSTRTQGRRKNPLLGTVRRFFQNKKAVVGASLITLFIVLAIIAPLLTHLSPNATSFLPLQAPSGAHPLGTTSLGQDVFSQFVFGTRETLSVAIIAGAGTTVLSMLVGMVSGYVGGLMDEVLQLVTNVFLIIPGLPLVIVLAAVLPKSGDFTMVMVIILTGWAWGARVLRAQIMAMRSLPYVESAKMGGESMFSIVFREIMPNMFSLIFANLLFSIIYAVLTESGLQFLGLGDLKAVNWGTMLYWADTEGALLSGAWWWFVPPGLAIALFGAGLALLNYAVDELTNPKLRSQSRRRRRLQRS
ncbi:ABC transporter permease [Alicyclobacillus kakegawensis]|uniref:ABC transporter permease n=1 Tax=Alicyclobacillus kakegawensis TaxID=392012 RepID=UPI00146FDF6E|nr:ABC transporter permease [Alicyclobacillus kakegawensis]